MRLKGLINPLFENKKFKSIQKSINEKLYPIEVTGLSESGKSYILDGIYESVNKPIVIVTHSDVEARNLYEDLGFYTSKVFYLPTKETVFYNIDAISGDLRWARLKVIKEMLDTSKKIIVTSIEAFSSIYTPLDLYEKHNFKIQVGNTLDSNELFQKLIECGYERTEIVEGKGEFCLRGGIVDIYPPHSNFPFRIDMFDNEIESIKTFNVESQRSIEKVDAIEIFPAKETILNEEIIKEAIGKISSELNEVNLSRNNNEEISNRITEIVKSNIELLKENGSFETIDSYLPFFFDNPSTLFDYIKDYIIIVDDAQRCKGKLESVLFEFKENYESFLERGNILPSQGKLMLNLETILGNFQGKEVIAINSFHKEDSFLSSYLKVDFNQITLNNYQGQLDLLIEEIKDKKSNGFKTLILSGTKLRGERLVDTLRERNIESVYRENVEEIFEGEIAITFGNQLKGFEFSDLKLCLISDKEVFGEAKRKMPKKKANKKGVAKIRSFGELRPGDYVVHVNSGIGVFKGIKQIEVNGHKRDYLDIEYSKGDKLYVPVEQLDLVQKYIGAEGIEPKINKLGGNEWQKAKAKARKSINDIAGDLVKLYAARATLKGHKFIKDTEWQNQFEDEFPYEETPDQLTSLEEIKKDMESNKPMDRLLCGDVGYGKTEVAIRAAFKAVMDGKQVAFLVPTTILAEQHYKNFIKRFNGFPVKIDMISRFRSKKDQTTTLQYLKEGNIDILIGTHRLVSKDIQFKDLGLLIVDEEQRFGVTQKEKIKNVKKNIDVLTLSATPIPRTLHMSLTGVRDISVIETPPEDRYPIQTYVVEHNDQLLRDAILREINREGQVFFVHNRVESIQSIASYVQNLVPECKTSIIHGRMTERQLEKEMIGFMNKESNVLVCTSIIETGIDIPNVNTMIVYDADKMGLSQLYQLRGRVGRSNRVAYSYFVYQKDKVLTEVAEKRLKALKDFTELGSGFKIAMRDLEIRGAGNMMGSAQHGHMSSIGYDLYCRMLEDTIKIIKGEIDQEPVETTVDIKVDAFISSDYINDETQKIEIYKKIAAIENEEDYLYVKEELEDRYLSIPQTVFNLMDIAYIKSKARLLNIEEIKERNEEIIFTFESRERTDKRIFLKLLEKHKKNILFKFGDKPTFNYRFKDVKKEDLLKIFKDILDELVKNKNLKKK
ncbi:transcription-repair coupling factor [Clostridium tarantellae]|uniref:Transcription-repair-coupling factor n=1 Tax=Clostridium tarantellae TaxID=39493 RepID=A0A6I1MHD1_9CLOT|nr:transcription-repair coupling factor [Clostridium tarantellae]MPQ42173.1 transcription-repair coupling factor [Clostridium tarantellae]